MPVQCGFHSGISAWARRAAKRPPLCGLPLTRWATRQPLQGQGLFRRSELTLGGPLLPCALGCKTGAGRGGGESPLRPGTEAFLDIPLPCKRSAALQFSGFHLLGLGCCQGHCILPTGSAYAPSCTSQDCATMPCAHMRLKHQQPSTRPLACIHAVALQHGRERAPCRGCTQTLLPVGSVGVCVRGGEQGAPPPQGAAVLFCIYTQLWALAGCTLQVSKRSARAQHFGAAWEGAGGGGGGVAGGGALSAAPTFHSESMCAGGIFLLSFFSPAWKGNGIWGLSSLVMVTVACIPLWRDSDCVLRWKCISGFISFINLSPDEKKVCLQVREFLNCFFPLNCEVAPGGLEFWGWGSGGGGRNVLAQTGPSECLQRRPLPPTCECPACGGGQRTLS